jgi:demethylmenaquinone methyltransferase/2-methoxy-6-polyprenyl-1,4-benzoquinol methylase
MLALNSAQDKHVAPGEALPLEDASYDGVFSAFVFRNLDSIPKTLTEIERVLRPGGVAVIVDLSRPRNAILRWIHRIGSFVALNLVGLAFGSRDEYSYLHGTLDKLPLAEELYSDSPIPVHDVWRMGPLGFVYGVELRKPD